MAAWRAKDKQTGVIAMNRLTSPQRNLTAQRRSHRLLVLTLGLALSRFAVAQTPVFVDWISANGPQGTATGKLGGTVDVTLTGPAFDPQYFVLDGSSTVFNSADFSPKLTKSDKAYTIATPTPQAYRISFSQPVMDPIIHFYSLASVVTFDTTNLAKLSGPGGVVVCSANVFGMYDPGLNNPNGSVQLKGIYSSVNFTIVFPYTTDGIGYQIGGIPVTANQTKLTAVPAVELSFPAEPNRIYQVQYTSELPAKNWQSLGGMIIGDGTPQTVFDHTAPDAQRVYRLLTVQ